MPSATRKPGASSLSRKPTSINKSSTAPTAKGKAKAPRGSQSSKPKSAVVASSKGSTKTKRNEDDDSSSSQGDGDAPSKPVKAKAVDPLAKAGAKKDPKGGSAARGTASAQNGKAFSAKASNKTSAELSDDEYSNSDEQEASDDDALLAGFSDVSGSDAGADSSDEDEEDNNIPGSGKKGIISASGVVKLPSSRDDTVVRHRLDKANKKRRERESDSTPIVLYFGRVPKSMPEDSLRAYLNQFGDVQRLRLARNKKTGATKHYAFVEFADEDVGNIVCETMHNYLLEGRLLQVHVVPKEKLHPNLWIGANRKYRAVPGARRHRVLHDERPRSDEQKQRASKRLLERQDERRKKIKASGIEYDFEGYA